MDDSLRSTTPVTGAGGFAGRAPAQRHEQRGASAPSEPERAADRVDVDAAVAVARRVLRERVLARTRERLELGDGVQAPEFAEAIDAEPVAAFVGRLLSAQNQLAAPRAQPWGSTRVRQALDDALRDGAAEAIELLAADPRDPGGAAVVADALAEYARRLAQLAADETVGPTGDGPADEPAGGPVR